jgi:CRP-like cAMP-binding protein
VNGTVEVYITTPTQEQVIVTTLVAGQYFGEMSLLTGEPVSASVILKTESSIIEINHENMETLFAQRPELMSKMSEVVVLRKLQNENVRASLSHEDHKEQKTLISRMTERVRSFFKNKQIE